MPKKLAFVTLGLLNEPMGHPATQGFMDRIGAAYGAADTSNGFVTRSERDLDTLSHKWGDVIAPKCYAPQNDPLMMPSTLSIWEDLESVAAYAYHGAHGEALSKRKDWFAKVGLPIYAAWWVDESTETLNRQDAANRIDYLHANGPSPFAFTFSQPFDVDGNPCTLDNAKVRAKAAANTGA